MMPVLSPNTQAILLLTAPLIAGRGNAAHDLLTPSEYKRLARHLVELHHQPADLTSPNAGELLQACHPVIDETRLKRLLERGFLLSQAVERWHARAIWVMSRADAGYPKNLKSRLREDAPAILYGCGDISLASNGGLAVVGSRHVDDSLIHYTESIGQVTARFGKMLVSGGAKGVDQAAMRGTLVAGGKVCCVLADSLERMAMLREYRPRLLEGNLVLISPYDPNAGFNVGNAMQRNKLIYALADACLIIHSDINKGGTWAGAVEQLDKFKFIPVYVRSTGEPSMGLDALVKKGAIAWPNPEDEASFNTVFSVKPHYPEITPSPREGQATSASPIIERSDINLEEDLKQDPTPANVLFAAVRQLLLQLLNKPMKDTEIAALLDVSTTQAKAWLSRLVHEEKLEVQKKPVAYIIKRKGLFD